MRAIELRALGDLLSATRRFCLLIPLRLRSRAELSAFFLEDLFFATETPARAGGAILRYGGRTFQSGFFPGVEGTPFSFGDPSIDVDRHGNYYFAQLGQTADGKHGAISVNVSHEPLHNPGYRRMRP